MKKQPFRLGMERFLENPERYAKRGARIGVLTHAGARLSNGQSAWDALLALPTLSLVRVFTPEHGLFGAAQDMEAVSAQEAALPFAVTSLYGDSIESLWPSMSDLADLDALVIDLQDIGSRYYTYVYTMYFAMTRAKAAGVPVIVCDRPNPLGGILREGCEQERAFCSFVGWLPLPVRHGLTIGELAGAWNAQEKIGCDLTTIPMTGWRRDQLGLGGDLWVNPSPNMPSLAAALTYPGTCLVEGTNLSEGRGTTRPFEWIGAPFIDSAVWVRALRALDLPGVDFLPWSFVPQFQKWKGTLCHGVQIAVNDPQTFRPYRTGCGLLHTAHQLYPQDFKWRTEPYEFVADRPAIDLLSGSARFREAVERGFGFASIMDELGEPRVAPVKDAWLYS